MSGKIYLQENDIRRFACDSALYFLKVMFEKAEAIRQSDSTWAVHDMRVASRRLRECFHLFGSFYPPKKLRKASDAVKAVTRMLGIPREMDVNVSLLRAYKPKRAEWIKACHEYLLEIFEFEQARRRKKMLKECDALDLKSLESSLVPFAQTVWDGSSASSMLLDARKAAELQAFLNQAAQVLQEKAAPLQAFGAAHDFTPEADPQLHRLRIDIKKCRYCLEILNPLYARQFDKGIELTKRLQETLGRIHDYGVLVEQLKAQHGRLSEKHRTRLAKGSQQVITELEGLKESFYADAKPAYLACVKELQHCLPTVSMTPAIQPAEVAVKECVADSPATAEAQEADAPEQAS
jgi:CHAD domain-containing protein